MADVTLPEGLFLPDGDGYLPTELTRGPWRADAQHGGPPSALLGHLTETVIDIGEFIAFIEVELTRPVPLSRLDVTVERERVSSRVSRVRAQLRSDGQVVSRSNALVLSQADDLAPPDHVSPQRQRTIPDESTRVDPPFWASGAGHLTYHRDAVEHRFVEGGFRTPGPAHDWVRLLRPVVVDAEPTGMQRVLAAADFGSGISAIYADTSAFGLINANLAVTVHRRAVGEWVSLSAITTLAPQGTGTCITTIADVGGDVAVATQSLLGYRLRSSR